MMLEMTEELARTLTLSSAGIAFIGCLVAAYTDFRWGIVPDKLNYALVACGIVLVFLRFELWDMLLIYGIATLIFLIGLAAYLFGQLGGGDVKFFAALTLLIPFYPQALAALSPFGPYDYIPYPFIVSVFFAAAVLAVFFVSIKYITMLWKDREKVEDVRGKTFHGLLNSAFVFVPMTIAFALMNPMMMFVVVPVTFGAFLLPFKESILKNYVVIEKRVKDLNDDDVLALELMSEDVKKKLGLSQRKTFLSIELKGLKANAKKNGITKVLVSEHLPRFVPYVLISLILNMLLGDAFLWLLSLKSF